MRTERERLTDVLRAEANGNDLMPVEYQCPGVAVLAERSDGNKYQLGFVSNELIYQDRDAAVHAISQIKFQKATS